MSIIKSSSDTVLEIKPQPALSFGIWKVFDISNLTIRKYKLCYFIEIERSIHVISFDMTAVYIFLFAESLLSEFSSIHMLQ